MSRSLRGLRRSAYPLDLHGAESQLMCGETCLRHASCLVPATSCKTYIKTVLYLVTLYRSFDVATAHTSRAELGRLTGDFEV